jgi:hypothetical protein
MTALEETLAWGCLIFASGAAIVVITDLVCLLVAP